MTTFHSKTVKYSGLGLAALSAGLLLAACGNNSNSASANKNEINWYTPTEIITYVLIKMVFQSLTWLNQLMCHQTVLPTQQLYETT